MRIGGWLLGTVAGTMLCVASLLVLGITLPVRCDAPNPFYDVAFAGSRTATHPDTRGVDNPYGPSTCESHRPRWEEEMSWVAILAALLLSGAAATRIGTTLMPWRGAVAVVGLVISALIATLAAYVGGWLVKRGASRAHRAVPSR
jgi:hypothetical protein